ncbi:MAG: saccharopine dehydrogenase NADP-binding domain-containing protein [Bacteroidia bacterium]|nr:saccharopine dehydrogenase NADP-binding domain-containing protein [Bacteroidia bacterium]
MHKIVVLGAGMVGSAMAIDLAKTSKVTVCDRNRQSLEEIKSRCNTLETQLLDVSDLDTLKATIKDFDLVICAVPGFLGYQTLKSIIETGKNVVDISFFPENALDLHELAQKMKVTAIVDCGVAPGMSNFVLGYYNEQLQIHFFECLVGGLPKVKKWPFNYKAPFSPVDVIEEYTRPARYVENGEIVTKPALSDTEYINFDRVGTLESFNSDGLRSIIYTMPHIKNMKEKTLRYPGHVELIKALRDSGFFSQEAMVFKGQTLTPLDFTTGILVKEWKLGATEEEFTVMRISVRGINKQGKEETIVYDLYDEYNVQTQTSSMARTTGYTATAAAGLLLKGLFTAKGVFPPELVGKHPNCFNFVLQHLEERGVVYHKTQTTA